MTIFLATTTVGVYRGETQNGLGDPEPSTTPLAGLEQLPFAITEKSRRVFVPESGELRTVRYGIGRCVGTADLRKGDRLKDTRTGKWWAIDEVTSGERTMIGQTPLVCDLRRV